MLYNKETNDIMRAQMMTILNKQTIGLPIAYTKVSADLPHIPAPLKRAVAITLDHTYVSIDLRKHGKIYYTRLAPIPHRLAYVSSKTAQEIILWALAKYDRPDPKTGLYGLSLRTLTQVTRVLNYEQRLEALNKLLETNKVSPTCTQPVIYRLFENFSYFAEEKE